MTKTFIETYAVHFHNVLGPFYKGLFFPHPICAQNSTMTNEKYLSIYWKDPSLG